MHHGSSADARLGVSFDQTTFPPYLLSALDHCKKISLLKNILIMWIKKELHLFAFGLLINVKLTLIIVSN